MNRVFNYKVILNNIFLNNNKISVKNNIIYKIYKKMIIKNKIIANCLIIQVTLLISK